MAAVPVPRERRSVHRRNLTTFCRTEFEYQGRSMRALMVNATAMGAQFLVDEFNEDFALSAEDLLRVDIQTGYGHAPRTGRIIWARPRDGSYFFAIEFQDPPQNEDDPLVALLDSPF